MEQHGQSFRKSHLNLKSHTQPNEHSVKEQNKDISKIQELRKFTSHKVIENIQSTKKAAK